MPKSFCSAEEVVSRFAESVRKEFYNRAIVEPRRKGKEFGITLDIEIKDQVLWLVFRKDNEIHCINVPIPYMEKGVVLLKQNEVVRAVSPYFLEKTQSYLGFTAVIERIIMGNPEGIIPYGMIKKTNFLQQVIYGFINGNAAVIIHNLQRAINEVIARMPLHNTYMNSWAMNHRLIIVDEDFDTLTDPAEQLEYQITKNRKYFHLGWTSMGMSEGTLAHKNFILTKDLRPLTPFGLKSHNPQRNLYSTLGMVGDELPLVRSQSMQDLMNLGITRTGWNFFTLFVDIPDVFEDQILVDNIHKDKYIEKTKRIQCFGTVLVQEGEVIKKGDVISVNNNEEKKKFGTISDLAWVHEIREGEVNIGGNKTKVWNVIIKYRRNFKDGMKLNNLHANKGIIRMKDLGYAKDPRTGELRKIDVIVSANAVMKRKNYGQILEALVNNANGEREIVIPDNYDANIDTVKSRLQAEGFNSDGTWECETYVGSLTGICGKVFWGITKDVEDAIWERGDTTRVNGRDLREAGMKFSSIELSALEVLFGKDNAVTAEVLSWAQGNDDVHEMLKIANSKTGVLPENTPIVNGINVTFVNQTAGIITDEEVIKGTIADEMYYPNGFVLQLPVPYQVVTYKNGDIAEGIPNNNIIMDESIKAIYTFDKIYVPKGLLRRCWRHENGQVGLNDIGAVLNNLITITHRHLYNPDESIHITMLYRAIATYFRVIADKLGGKRGDISNYCMSVRYPNSVKAVAALSNRLPNNTVEIHRSMAKQLGTYNGDIVIAIRFPVLGFTCVRPQMVKITDDPQAKFTIRVSGNSLCSAGLDFDGDVIYLTSFKTQGAKDLLMREWSNPRDVYYSFIEELNRKMGVPHTKCMNIDDYNVSAFEPLNEDWHADIIKSCTGVKAHTGPVIALTYNLMRLLENSEIDNDTKVKAAIHVFMDKVANSIFKQKHIGIKPLHETVVDALCSGNVQVLVENGFKESTSTIIINIIRQKALGIGISNIAEYHKKAKERKWSNIINKLVRMQNVTYFASRAKLDLCDIVTCLSQEPVDLPSRTFKWVMYDKPVVDRERNVKSLFASLMEEHFPKS